MALPKTGITTSMVGQALGTSTRNVGALCTSSLINMWSRCKPVDLVTATPSRVMPADGMNAWWKGSSGDCGVKPPSVVSYSNIPGMYTTDMRNGYTYQGPRGGSGSPYRLADFMYYDHYAKPPMSGFTCSDKASTTGTITCSIQLNVMTTDKSGPGSLAIDDINFGRDVNLSEWYFGVMVVDGNGAIRKKIANAKAKLGIVSISANGLIQGSAYKVYPFLCENQIASETSGDSSNKFIPLPNCAPASVKIVSSTEAADISILMTGDYEYKDGRKYAVIWKFVVTNNSKSSVTLRNNALKLRFIGKNPEDRMEDGELTKAISDMTIQANGKYEESGTFNLTTGFEKSHYLYLTLDTAKYKHRRDVFAPFIPSI